MKRPATERKKPLSIAIFTDAFFPQVNGIVTVTVDLAEHLADRGHRVCIIAPRHTGTKAYHHKNITIKYVPSIPALFYDSFRFTSVVSRDIVKLLKQERVDVIHFQTPITLGAQAILASRYLKKPLLGTYHTIFSDPQYLRHAKLSSKLAEKLSWGYARLYYDRCDVVTCPTESTKNELLKRKFKGPFTVISNGITWSQFDNRKWKSAKQKYNPNGKILLFVGRIAYEKNLPYLLECFALVHKACPKTKFVLVGDGPQMEDIREHVHKLHLTNSVIFTGNVPHAKLVTSGIYKAADLFVTASTTETQGITLLEAHANGLPTVGVKARGVAEVIEHGKNGLLVQNKNKKAFANAVIRILTSDALRAKLAQGSLRTVQQHDMECITDTWEAQYYTLIEKHGKKE